MIEVNVFYQAEDDKQPVYVPKAREYEDTDMKVTRDKLNILMETFYKEVEKLRDQALQVNIIQQTHTFWAKMGNIKFYFCFLKIPCELCQLSENEKSLRRKSMGKRGFIEGWVDKW